MEVLASAFGGVRRGDPGGVAAARVFMAFDCLHVAGRDLRPLELRARRDWLEDALEGHLILPARRLADDGLTAWAEVLEAGYEGLVPKGPAPPSRGGPTPTGVNVQRP